jgi:hypothetical protein
MVPIKKHICIFLMLVTLTACSSQTSEKNNENINYLTKPIWTISPQFSYADNFSEGVAFVEDNNETSHIIDKNGSSVWDKKFAGILENHFHYVPFTFGIAKYGDDNGELFITRTGKQITTETSQRLVERQEPLEVTSDSDTSLFGCINKQNLWYLEPKYSYGYSTESRGYVGKRKEYSVLLNEETNQYWLVSSNGDISELKLPFTDLAFISGISENCMVISHYLNNNPDKTNSKEVYQYADLKGNLIFQGEFEDAKPFSEGLAAVKMNGKYGFIDKNGEMKIAPQYLSVGILSDGFSEGLASVEFEDGNWGFVDQNGQMAFKVGKSCALGDFHSGYEVFVNSRLKYCITDKSGKKVLNASYDDIELKNGVYSLEKGEKYGLYIPSINALIPAKYDSISIWDDRYASLYSSGKSCVINLETGASITLKNTRTCGCNENIICAQDTKTDLYGYMDLKGNWLIAPQFQDANVFSEGLACVEQNGLYGYIVNPNIYSSWSSEEIERAKLLRIADSFSDEPATLDNLWGIVGNVFKAQNNLNDITSERKFNKDQSTLSNLLNCYNLTGSATLNREQAAKVITELCKYYGKSVICYVNLFEDAKSVDSGFESSVAYVSSLGVFDSPDGNFSPKATITQKELAIVMLRLLEYLQ